MSFDRSNDLTECRFPSNPVLGSYNVTLYIENYSKPFENPLHIVGFPNLTLVGFQTKDSLPNIKVFNK